MYPIFKIGNTDYTRYVESLKPTQNDLDKDGAGRNILTGKMYRKKITTKGKWTVAFRRLSESVMRQLRGDMNHEYVNVTILDSLSNSYVTKECYCATINEGEQHYSKGTEMLPYIDRNRVVYEFVSPGQTVYDGVTFDVTER